MNLPFFTTLAFLSMSLLSFQGEAQQRCQAQFYGPGTGVAGSSVSFQDTSTGISPNTTFYVWDFGDRNYSSGLGKTSARHTYSQAGAYSVCLTISDSLSGCRSTYCDSIVITKNQNCDADFNLRIDQKTKKVTLNNRSSILSGAEYVAYWGPNDSTKFYGHNQSVSHTYSSSGKFSVRLVQRTANCTSSESQNFTLKTCFAAARIQQDSANSCTYSFINQSRGSSSATYKWHFGNGDSSSQKSPKYTYAKDGYYTVRLQLADSNCWSFYTDTIQVRGCSNSSSCRLTISGQVIAGNSNAEYAKVYLIEKKGNIISAVDTVSTDSLGNYQFTGLCNDTFYIKAALDSLDQNYSSYMPTYYGDELRWDSSTTVALTNHQRGLNINLWRGANRGGPGFIGGDVRRGANKREGDPIQGVQIMILNARGEGVAYDYSQFSGAFELDQLEFGTYYLMAEVPGLPSNGKWFTIDERSPKVEDVVIEVNENTVYTDIRILKPETYLNLTVYPNPAQTHIQIETAGSGNIRVMNTLGQVLIEKSVNGRSQINIDALEKGIYYLEYKTPQGAIGTTSFVKN